MADQPQGGSVATTAAVAMPTGAALIVLQYLVHPAWPPPDPVMTIVATAAIPVVHLLGKAVMNRLTKVASDIDPSDDVPPPAPVPPATPPNPPAPPITVTPPGGPA